MKKEQNSKKQAAVARQQHIQHFKKALTGDFANNMCDKYPALQGLHYQSRNVILFILFAFECDQERDRKVSLDDCGDFCNYTNIVDISSVIAKIHLYTNYDLWYYPQYGHGSEQDEWVIVTRSLCDEIVQSNLLKTQFAQYCMIILDTIVIVICLAICTYSKNMMALSLFAIVVASQWQSKKERYQQRKKEIQGYQRIVRLMNKNKTN